VAGEFIVHIGYQHPPDDLIRIARKAGARIVYVSLRPDRDFVRDKNVIWIDPMWDWPDACVPLEGYDVPLLAASGVINGAIAWDIYRGVPKAFGTTRAMGYLRRRSLMDAARPASEHSAPSTDGSGTSGTSGGGPCSGHAGDQVQPSHVPSTSVRSPQPTQDEAQTSPSGLVQYSHQCVLDHVWLS
jgi:hypothetical protein